MDEIGSVIMDVEEELVMPDIPVKPNNAIPIAIGIMLILGGLLGAILAFGSAAVYIIDDEMRGEAGFTDEQNATFDMLQDSGMAATFTVFYSVMTIGLIASGILLIRRKSLGVKLGAGSASIFIIANIVETIWMHQVAGDYGFKAEIGVNLIFEVMCGLFCVALPLVAIMIPEGRAALYPSTIVLETHEEE